MNSQDLCFGDFTKEELNSYFDLNINKKNNNIQRDNNNSQNSHQSNYNKKLNGVEFPWSSNSTTTTELNSLDNDIINIEFGFDIPKYCYSSNNNNNNNNNSTLTNTVSYVHLIKQTTSNNSHSHSHKKYRINKVNKSNLTRMDNSEQAKLDQSNATQIAANAAAAETQRRNKKRRPPDYYKKDYPVEILKTNETVGDETTLTTTSMNDDVSTATTTTTTTNKNEDLADNLKKNLILNDKNNNTANGSGSTDSVEESSVSSSASNAEEDTTQAAAAATTTTTTTATSQQQQTVEEAPQTNGVSIETTTSTEPQQSKPQEPLSQQKSGPWGGSKTWSSLFKGAVRPNTSTPTTTTTTNTSSPATATTTTSEVKSETKTPVQQHQQALEPQLSSSVNGDHVNTTASTAAQNNSDVLRSLGHTFKTCELKHSAPALQPRGLRNSSNWCYVNATLQALLACPPLFNLIRNTFAKTKHSNIDSRHIPCIYALGRFVNEFKTMVRPSTSHESQTKKSKDLVFGEPFEIDYFYEALANLKADLAFKGRQEDAQEFLSFLLNRLHDEMVKCLESQDPTKQQQQQESNSQTTTTTAIQYNGLTYVNELQDQQSATTNDNDDDDEWQEVGKKNKAFVTRRAEFKQSPLSDIFCGQFRTALSQQGLRDKESISLEPFFTLPLDIQSDSVRTIHDALDHFVKKEEILDLTHPETKQHIEAYKRISFEDLPPVLILYLKCFVYDKSGGIQKLFKRVDYQIDLEISKNLISPNQRIKLNEKKRTYKLFAVEYHYGEKATGGHYITDVYHPGIVGWVRYDDANVKVITNLDVLKSSEKKLVPYLLYYRRTDLI